MTLIVEDGTGKADAESYASEAYATAYFGARGKADAWDAVEDKEAALRLATDFLHAQYAQRWHGMRSTSAQALDWPRQGVPRPDDPVGEYAANALPVHLLRATCELALRAGAAPLLEDEGREIQSVQVDVLSVNYADGKPKQTHYTEVHRMLRPLLMGTGELKVERC